MTKPENVGVYPPNPASGTEASDGKYVCRICNDVGPDLPANKSHTIGGWLCKKCYRETIAVKPAIGTEENANGQ